MAAALLVPLPARAKAQPQLEPGSGSPAGAELDVFHVVIGQGDLVWEKFGHNALWVHDPVAGTDRVYNYGLFDFASPGYWGRFIKGNWIYQVGQNDIADLLWHYRSADRQIVAQRLNLSPAEKAEVQRFLEWNTRPENREYLYDYFRDNCSTRVRDVLDAVLGGRIGKATRGLATLTTYRWHSERLMADDQVTSTGLLAGLGPAADRPIDAWEEMFLPEKVQERLRTIRLADGSPLVAEERILNPSLNREEPRSQPPSRLGWYLLLGSALAAILVLTGRKATSSRAARFAFTALSGLWLLFAGTGGIILLALWAFTNHTIAYRNENVLQLSPLALPLVLLVPALAFGARWAARPAWWLAASIAALSLLGLAAQPLPGLDQVNGGIIALALPINLALAYVVLVLAREAGGRNPAAAPPERPVHAAARGS